MARTAKLEIEIDSRRAKPAGTEADRVLQGLKRTARETYEELRGIGRGGDAAAAGMRKAGQGASAADNELKRMRATANGAARDMRSLANESTAVSGALRRGVGGVNEAIGSFNALRGAAIAIIGVGLAKEMLTSADAVRGWNAQLKLAIPTSVSLTAATRDVRRVAADTNSGISETNDLYARFSRSARDLGKSQTEASRATETFAKTLRISGADTAAASAITTQFGQALGSGVLRGDEFNSMMEGAPRLARLLASSLDTNVGALRSMAENGELTADKLYKALTDKKFTASIDEEFKQIPITFDQAMTRVKDTATITFAAFDRGGEISQTLINFMLGGVENMDTMERRAESLGVEMRATFAGLYDVFQPMTAGADEAFAGIGIKISSVSEQIAGMLSMVDKVKNAGIALDRAVVWKDNLNPLTADKPMPAWSNLSGDYSTAVANRRAVGQAKVDEARVKASIPEFMRFDTPADMKAWMSGAYMDSGRKPAGAAGAEIGRSMSGADLDKALAGIGARITSRGRTPAQQQAQIDKWNREDPATRGIRPAGVNSSDHVRNGDTTRDIARGPGVSLATITQAVGKDNIKQLLNEGDHFHLALKGGKGGAGGGKSEAEKEADRQDRLRVKRKQDEADFFQQLEDQAKAAEKLPREAEQYNSELRLRKVLNDGNIAGDRELSEGQKQRIAGLIQERELATFQGNARRALLGMDQERMRLEDIGATLARSTVETEEQNLAIQQKLWPFKLDAMDRGLSLQDETVKKALAEVEARERTNQELEKRNQLVQEGVEVANQYGGPGVQQSNDRAALEQKKVAAGEAVWAGRITPEVYEATVKGLDQAIQEVDNRFRDQFIDSIGRLAGEFDGKIGAAMQSAAGILQVAAAQAKGDFSQSGVAGGIIGLFNGPKGNPVGEAAAKASQSTISKLMSTSTFTRPLSSLASGFGEFKGDLKSIFGRGGNFQQGLGNVLGKAGIGAQIGSAVSGIAGMVGIKLNKTGAQLGGAVGSAVGGPVGALIGSVGGGIIGNLFSKPKQASSTLSFENGVAVGGSPVGKGSAEKQTAAALSASVASGLNSIVSQLGGSLGSASVSIGYRPGHKDPAYRVDTSGKGKLTGVQAFATEAEAVSYAIADAIKDGVLTGLSPTLVRIVQMAGTDLDKAVNDALKVKGVQDQYRQMTDPVNFALEGLNKSFEDLATIMRNASASSQEMSNAQKVYEAQRAEIIAQGNNSALAEMRDYVFQLKGGTSSSLSAETRLATSKAELDRLDTLRGTGAAPDFGQYKSVADSFLAASRDANGSTSSYFADLKRVTDAVEGMQKSIVNPTVLTPALNIAPVTSAIDNQTSAVTALLASIDQKLGAGATGTASTAPVASGGAGAYESYAVDVPTARYYNLN